MGHLWLDVCVDLFICVAFADDSRSEETEMIMMDTELWVSLSETDVGSFLVDATYNCTDY